MMKTSCRRFIGENIGWPTLFHQIWLKTNVTKTITFGFCAGMHAWHTDRASRSQAPFLFRYTILAYIAPLLDDMRSVEEYVAEEAAEIDYTFVLPPGLNNKPVTGERGRDKISIAIRYSHTVDIGRPGHTVIGGIILEIDIRIPVENTTVGGRIYGPVDRLLGQPDCHFLGLIF